MSKTKKSDNQRKTQDPVLPSAIDDSAGAQGEGRSSRLRRLSGFIRDKASVNPLTLHAFCQKYKLAPLTSSPP